MENSQLLVPLNEALTVKSAARMRAVSRTLRDNIIVKKYSFYKKFQKLEISSRKIIELLFNFDPEFVELDDPADFYTPIEHHVLGNRIAQFIHFTEYYWIVVDFSYIATDQDPDDDRSLVQAACDHVMTYTDYQPLQGLLIEMCVNEYSDNKSNG